MCELSPVSFHGDTIYCIDFQNQPFTPMKPIVENLGLDWSSQSAKLRTNQKRWGIEMISISSTSTMAMIATVAKDGKEREMLCLPVRKLPAYLASINPNKVREELRPKIELYQAESDDALWNYWMNGKAERKTSQSNETLTPADQNVIQTLVKAIADRYPAEEQKSVYMQVWMRFRNHFRLGSYKDLPGSRMAEAVAYLANLKVHEKKVAAQPQKELPQAQAPLAETGASALEDYRRMRRDFAASFLKIHGSVMDALYHRSYPVMNTDQQQLADSLHAALCTFNMSVGTGLDAIENMFQAFCAAEKTLHG